MFERNKIETVSVAPQVPVPAEITLTDGKTLRGRLLVAASRAVHDVVNGPSAFLEFEPYGEERLFISKAAVLALKLVAIPQAANLAGRAKETEGFDPWRVLGLERKAPWDEVRQAYLTLAKIYHPDRFGGVDLPREIKDYVAAMARRINIAYATLEATELSAKTAAHNRAAPVYTTPSRG